MATSVGQKFEVFASKTEVDAKALASSHPGALCFTTDKHSIVFNGLVYSLTEIVNVLTDSSTDKALSAAQGKALKALIDALPTTSEMNSAINAAVGSVYKVKGTKTNISEVVALTNAKVGDVWNVTNEFTLSSKKYPAGTNVVCTTATSSSDHDEGNWDALGGTVDLSQYLTIANAVSTYLKKTDAESTYLKKADVVNNLTTSTTGKALDAAQGLALKNLINSKIGTEEFGVLFNGYINDIDLIKNIEVMKDYEVTLSSGESLVLVNEINKDEFPVNEKATKTAIGKMIIKETGQGNYKHTYNYLYIPVQGVNEGNSSNPTPHNQFGGVLLISEPNISNNSPSSNIRIFTRASSFNKDDGSLIKRNKFVEFKFGPNNILQSTGTSTTSAMSQDSVTKELNKKQANLVSGTNIKTVNGQSVLGSGNIDVSIIIQ